MARSFTTHGNYRRSFCRIWQRLCLGRWQYFSQIVHASSTLEIHPKSLSSDTTSHDAAQIGKRCRRFDADALNKMPRKFRKWCDDQEFKQSQQQRPGLSKRALWGCILNFRADIELRRLRLYSALVRAAELPRLSKYMNAGEQDLVPGCVIVDIAYNQLKVKSLSCARFYNIFAWCRCVRAVSFNLMFERWALSHNISKTATSFVSSTTRAERARYPSCGSSQRRAVRAIKP